jgi:nucleotide sugar dehydrogenase
MVEQASVCVIGLGFVGLTLATKLSETHRVFGLDNNESIVASVSRGIPHFHEGGLTESLHQGVKSGQLSAHTDWADIPLVDVYVITVGTPVSFGEVNLVVLEKVVSELSSRVRPKDLVIVRSTVKVGSTREAFSKAFTSSEAIPLVAMCPERTIEGSALRELVELPQIVSGINEESLSAASTFFQSFGCQVVPVSSIEAAEFAKLMNNTYRDVQFGFANEMAIASQALGLDIREIIRAANKDYARSNVAMPGTTGGPCLEKDPWILVESAARVGAKASITQLSRELHEALPALAVNRIHNEIEATNTFAVSEIFDVSILGLAFKGQPATDDIRGSLAKKLVEKVRNTFPNARVLGVDKEVSNEDALSLGIDQLVSTSTALDSSKVAIIHNNHKTLQEEIRKNLELPRRAALLVFDFWGVVEKGRINESVKLITFGDGTA